MKAPKKSSDVNVAPIVKLSDAEAAAITGGGGYLWNDYYGVQQYRVSGSLYKGYIYAAPGDPVYPGDPVFPSDPIRTYYW